MERAAAKGAGNEVHSTWPGREPRGGRVTIRELHRRQVAASGPREIPAQPLPGDGRPICEVAESTPEDIETALDAAHAAAPPGAEASHAERAEVLNAIADAIDAHREMLAVTESWENGKPVRETLAADIPLAADHFRYFAAAIRCSRRHDHRNRREHRGLPLPRAARSGRADHPVQLPAADGGVEAGAGPGRGQLHGDQARLADPVVDTQAGRGDRGRRAAGRAQHRDRPRRRDRQSAGHQSAHRQGGLHRRDHDRPADHAVRGAEHHPGDARARRQVAEHLLLRRDGDAR